MVIPFTNCRSAMCRNSIAAVIVLLALGGCAGSSQTPSPHNDATVFSGGKSDQCRVLGAWIDHMLDLAGGTEPFRSRGRWGGNPVKARQAALPAFNNQVFIQYFGIPFIELSASQRRTVYRRLTQCYPDAPMMWVLKDAFDKNIKARRVADWLRDVAALDHRLYTPSTRKPKSAPIASPSSADVLPVEQEHLNGVYEGVARFKNKKRFFEVGISTYTSFSDRILQVNIYYGDQKRYDFETYFARGHYDADTKILSVDPSTFIVRGQRSSYINAPDRFWTVQAKGSTNIRFYNATLHKVQNAAQSKALESYLHTQYRSFISKQDSSYVIAGDVFLRALWIHFETLGDLFKRSTPAVTYKPHSVGPLFADALIMDSLYAKPRARSYTVAALSPFRNLEYLSVYPEGVDQTEANKHYEIRLDTTGRYTDVVITRTPTHEARINVHRAEREAERQRRAANLEAEREKLRNSVPVEERINFSAAPFDDDAFRAVVRDIYYGRFERIDRRTLSLDDQVALFGNYHLLVSKAHNWQAEPRRGYIQRTFSAGPDVAPVTLYLQPQYHSLWERAFRASVTRYNSVLEGLIALYRGYNAQQMRTNINVLVDLFPPGTAASARFNENLYRFISRDSPLPRRP